MSHRGNAAAQFAASLAEEVALHAADLDEALLAARNGTPEAMIHDTRRQRGSIWRVTPGIVACVQLGLQHGYIPA